MNTKEWIVKDTLNNRYVQVLVRCKDCIHRFNGCCYNKESNRVNFGVYVADDWFCADGERRNGNDLED